MLPICVCPSGQKKLLEPLKLKFQEVVSCPVWMCSLLRSKVQKEVQGRMLLFLCAAFLFTPCSNYIVPPPQVLLGEAVPLVLVDQE